MTLARVTTAAEAAALDASAIGAGTPARMLMQTAGLGAAAAIVRAYPDIVGAAVTVYAGPGNNGGDGWVVARALVSYGARVFVHEAGDARTEESKAERALALPLVTRGESADARLIVDALLGVGSKGAPRGEIAAGIARIREAQRPRRGGGLAGYPERGRCGHGLRDRRRARRPHDRLRYSQARTRGRARQYRPHPRSSTSDSDRRRPTRSAPMLVDAHWVRAHVPPIRAEAHKGTRRKLIIIGGAVGMAGAPMLAARAAMRSGIGMVRLVVARENLPVVQAAVPEAPAHAWPETVADVESVITGWADAVVIGPGLGAFVR